MPGEFDVSFTREYFGEWAQTLRADQSLYVPQENRLRPLMSLERFNNPYTTDAAGFAAVQVTQSSAFAQELEGFAKEESAGRKIQRLRRVYKDSRDALEEHEDIVELVLDATTGAEQTLKHKVVSYLALGMSPTRLGDTINMPGKDAEDRPLLTLLRLIRVIAEHEMDEQFKLKWLADQETPEAA